MIIVGRAEGLNRREEWTVQGKAVREYGRHYGAPLKRKMDGKIEIAMERRIFCQMIMIEVQLYLIVVRVRPEKGGVVSHVYSY